MAPAFSSSSAILFFLPVAATWAAIAGSLTDTVSSWGKCWGTPDAAAARAFCSPLCSCRGGACDWKRGGQKGALSATGQGEGAVIQLKQSHSDPPDASIMLTSILVISMWLRTFREGSSFEMSSMKVAD